MHEGAVPSVRPDRTVVAAAGATFAVAVLPAAETDIVGADTVPVTEPELLTVIAVPYVNFPLTDPWGVYKAETEFAKARAPKSDERFKSPSSIQLVPLNANSSLLYTNTSPATGV